MSPSSRRAAGLHGPWLAFLGSLALFVTLVTLLGWMTQEHGARAKVPLMVACAAGIKAPVEAIAQRYQAEYGVEVQLQYGGSQTLLANAELSRQGDLYLPADDSYLDLARDKGLLAETIPLASMRAVLAVKRGNPLRIATLEDLLRPRVRVAQANPEAAAIGKITRTLITKTGRWKELVTRTVVFKPTVADVANDVVLGTVDVGIVWDVTVHAMKDSLEAVELPELQGGLALSSVAVLTTSSQPTEALHFARYMAAVDAGLVEFQARGFSVVEGDIWEDVPELRLFAGAMLRPAIKSTVTEFARREGIRITEVYNGCGILVAQMRAAQGDCPDVYFACDRSFMDQVNDLFPSAIDVSSNQLVLLVKKGNPHRLNTLEDLGKPGLRVGIGHEKQCALGVLTQQALKQGGALSRVMPNVTVQTPTGDMLVNQLLAGGLDVAVAYISNAAHAGADLEAIPLDLPCAKAQQPLAVAADSRRKHLAARLVAALQSAESRSRFEAEGFGWGALPK